MTNTPKAVPAVAKPDFRCALEVYDQGNFTRYLELWWKGLISGTIPPVTIRGWLHGALMAMPSGHTAAVCELYFLCNIVDIYHKV